MLNLNNFKNVVYIKNFIKHNIENKDVFGIYLNQDFKVASNSFIKFNCGIEFFSKKEDEQIDKISIYLKGILFDKENPNIIICGNCFNLQEELCLFICNRSNNEIILKKDTCIAKGYFVISAEVLLEEIDSTKKYQTFYDYTGIKVLEKQQGLIESVELIDDMLGNKKIILCLNNNQLVENK